VTAKEMKIFGLENTLPPARRTLFERFYAENKALAP
jgi:hypothetical protein